MGSQQGEACRSETCFQGEGRPTPLPPAALLQAGARASLTLGACGYAPPQSGVWPGYSTMALSPASALAAALPQGGCGACFEVQQCAGAQVREERGCDWRAAACLPR